MHNEACDQLGLDYSYLAFDVPEDKMPQAVEELRTMVQRAQEYHHATGKNIMCKLANREFLLLRNLGAYNTIVNDNGVYHRLHHRRCRLHEQLRKRREHIIGKR